MKLNKQGNVHFYTFDSFPRDELVHGVFTRLGGVSPEPWSSLNIGGTNGDSPENIIENRERIFCAVDRPVNSLFDTWQVHGNDVIVVRHPRGLMNHHTKADAIVTDRPEVTLLMRFADCVPILLYDPKRPAVALTHAGWKGTVSRTVGKTIKVMMSMFGSIPDELLAGIGPSICKEHYQVGPEVESHVRDAFGQKSNRILNNHDHRVYLDLWEANKITMEQMGVRHIEVAKMCTACNLNEWFSHRLEKAATGRFGVVIGLV